MLEASKYGLDFSALTVEKIKPLIVELLNASGPPRMLLLLEILSILSLLPYRKLSTMSEDAPARYAEDHRMNKILQYIHRQLTLDKALTLGETADAASMSPQSFSRYFRKTTFKRFIDYVNEVKIGKVCRQLINTDKTVAEICFESGFNNLSNFNLSLRPFTIGRKNWLFLGSKRGGEVASTLMSLVQTCRVMKIDVRTYLEDLHLHKLAERTIYKMPGFGKIASAHPKTV